MFGVEANGLVQSERSSQLIPPYNRLLFGEFSAVLVERDEVVKCEDS